MQTFIQNPAV